MTLTVVCYYIVGNWLLTVIVDRNSTMWLRELQTAVNHISVTVISAAQPRSLRLPSSPTSTTLARLTRLRQGRKRRQRRQTVFPARQVGGMCCWRTVTKRPAFTPCWSSSVLSSTARSTRLCLPHSRCSLESTNFFCVSENFCYRPTMCVTSLYACQMNWCLSFYCPPKTSLVPTVTWKFFQQLLRNVSFRQHEFLNPYTVFFTEPRVYKHRRSNSSDWWKYVISATVKKM